MQIRIGLVFQTVFVKSVVTFFGHFGSQVPLLFSGHEFLVQNWSFVGSLTPVSVNVNVTHFFNLNYKAVNFYFIYGKILQGVLGFWGKVASLIFAINLFDLGGSDALTKKGYKIENLMDFPGH